MYEEYMSDTNVEPKTEPKVEKLRKRIRHVLHEWTDEESLCLISAVQKRRALWDVRAPEYKMGAKNQRWKEVIEDLGGHISVQEAKVKWFNMRSTFKTNSMKMRCKKLGRGSNKSRKVSWRFFNAMLFIDPNQVISTESTPNVPSSSATIDCSISDQNGTTEPSIVRQRYQRLHSRPTIPPQNTRQTPPAQYTNPTPPVQYIKPTPPPQFTNPTPPAQCTKPTPPAQCNRPTMSPSESPSTSSQFKEMATYALTTLDTKDKHSTYGEFIACELRQLPDADANALRHQLTRTLWQFIENRQVPPLMLSQPIHADPLKAEGDNDETIFGDESQLSPAY